MTERREQKRPILKRFIDSFSRNDHNAMDEEDTRPLISIAQFNTLMRELDWIQISRGGNYDQAERVTSFKIRVQDIKDISQKSRDFLEINEAVSGNSSVLFSLYHHEGNQAWVVVQNSQRRIQYIFDVEKASCVAYFQTLTGENWSINPEVVHPLPDIEKVLKAGRKAKGLID